MAHVLKVWYDLPTHILRTWNDLQSASSDLIETHFRSPQFFQYLMQTSHRSDLITVSDDAGEVVGISPILYYTYPFGGRLAVNRRVAHLLGSLPICDPSDYDAVIDKILAGSDIVVLPSIPIGSQLWDCLHASITRTAIIYVVHTEDCHIMLLPDTCEKYFASFTKHRRHTLKRHIKQLTGTLGELHLQVITSKDQIPELRSAMLALNVDSTNRSRLSLASLYGSGSIKSSTDAELVSLADNGLLHCYILYSGETLCALMLGMRHDTVYYGESTHRAKLDPKLSAGTVIYHMLSEDLIRCGVKRIDFGYGAPSGHYINLHDTQSRAMIILMRKTMSNYVTYYYDRIYRQIAKYKFNLSSVFHTRSSR